MAARHDKRKREDCSDGEDSGSSHSLHPPSLVSAGKRPRLASPFVPSTFADDERTDDPISTCEQSNPSRPVSSGDGAQRAFPGSLRAPVSVRLARGLSQIRSVSNTPPPTVPIEIVSSNYDEWMQMAVDNKINAANSWDLALIDYFADMSLLRDADRSINFQKASCMLHGCVKIWTSRVDSIGNAINQLMSHLITGNDDEERSATYEDIAGAEQTAGARARSARRPRATTGSAQRLRKKTLDLDMGFTIDPLFRKTRADLDEGGPGSLLLNRLSVNGQLRVAFDSADYDEDEEENDHVEEKPDPIDISDLRCDFFPNLDDLDELAICQPLAGLPFNTTSDAPCGHKNCSDDAPTFDSNEDGRMEAVIPPGEHLSSDDHFNMQEYVSPAENNSSESENEELWSSGETGKGTHRGSRGGQSTIAAEQELTLAYFDSGSFKNWAGPEHWKVRRKYPQLAARQANVEKEPIGAKYKQTNTAFRVDFFAPPQHPPKQLFAPVVREERIKHPSLIRPRRFGAVDERAVLMSRDQHLLPEDEHFSSKKLMTLFSKPTFSLTIRSGIARFTGDGDHDGRFGGPRAKNWTARTSTSRGCQDTASGSTLLIPPQQHSDDYGDGIEYNSDAVAGGRDVGDATEQRDIPEGTIGSDPLWDHSSTTRSLGRSQRVDLRRLKENIWKNLGIVAERVTDPNAMEVDDIPQANNGPRTFGSVIKGLERAYLREELKCISSSLCFIGLLHLANEECLTITRVGSDQVNDAIDLDPGDMVGNIYTIQVNRDIPAHGN